MRRVGVWAACVLLSLVAAACERDIRYSREGVGIGLNYAELAEDTALQDAYIRYICSQAGLARPGPDDAPVCQLSRNDWPIFVQAGMNDIDKRCDAFLSWLDWKKRGTQPILQQIADTMSAADIVMTATSASNKSIAIVGAALGYARHTFTNVSSRLLLEVDQSTVQTIVLTRQQKYRFALQDVAITNQPEAIHALRSYLRICMPFTIETEINTTITVFDRGAGRALDDRPLVTPLTIDAAPATSRQQIRGRTPPNLQGDQALTAIFKGYAALKFPPSAANKVFDALCVLPGDRKQPGDVTKALIAIWENTEVQFSKPDGLIDEDERDSLLGKRDWMLKHKCNAESFKNFYERQWFKDGQGNTSQAAQLIVGLLNKVPHPTGMLATSTPLSNARTRIAEVRQTLEQDERYSKELTKLPGSMTSQWTIDLFNVLFKYQPVRPASQPSGAATQPPTTQPATAPAPQPVGPPTVRQPGNGR